MKVAIHKYELKVVESQSIRIPKNSIILGIHIQDDEPPCLWVMVNPIKPNEMKIIETYGSEQPIDNSEYLKYIGTYQLKSDRVVRHVFEHIEL